MHIYNGRMTLRLRNLILIILSFISLAVLGAAVYIGVGGYSAIDAASMQQIVPVSALLLFSTVAGIVIFLSFRNTASAEIFFFYFFIFSLLFDIFKIVVILFPDASLPFSYGMIATRLVYFGRFAGTLALFSSGLFSSGMEYQRMGIVFLFIIILSAALVWLLPVDISSTVAGGTWELGRFIELLIAVIFLEIVSVVNFTVAGRKNENPEYIIIAAALFLTVAGREILFFIPGYVSTAIGTALIVCGSIIFGLRTHGLYLWE